LKREASKKRIGQGNLQRMGFFPKKGGKRREIFDLAF
jgi:hypothetical protein